MRAHIFAFVGLVAAMNASADVWSRTLKIGGLGLAHSVAQSRDGTVFVVKQMLGGPCVTRLARESAETSCYGPASENNGGEIEPASEGYFVYDTNFENQQHVESGFVYRIDGSGNAKWARRYTADVDVNLMVARTATDGGLVMAGSLGTLRTPKGSYGVTSLIVKVDAGGAIQWQRTVDFSGSDTFAEVRIAPDGILAAGNADFGAFIYKLRATGETQWKTLLPRVGILSMTMLPAGDFAATGLIHDNGHEVDWVGRFDARGQLKWQRAGDQPTGGLRSVAVDAHGDLVAEESFEQVTERAGIGILTFDREGSLRSQLAISVPGLAEPFAVTRTSDGGFLIGEELDDQIVEVHKVGPDASVSACLAQGRTAIQRSFHTVPIGPLFSAVAIEERTPVLRGHTVPISRKQVASTLQMACVAGSTPALALEKPSATEAQSSAESKEIASYEAEVVRLIDQKDFARLDRMGSELRENRPRLLNGDFKAAHFYWVLSGKVGGGEEQQRLAFVDEWRRHMPASATAAIAAAGAYNNYAGRARGSQWASTVTEAAQQKVAGYLDRANSILDSATSVATGDPEYDVARALVAGLTSCEQLRNLRFEKDAAGRDYYRFFVSVANFLLPRWCGSPDEYRQFAEFAAQSGGPQHADETYGRLGLYALETEEHAPVGAPVPFFSTYRFDWPRMRGGLFDFAKRNPNAPILYHQLAWAAWKAGDRATARELFARPDLAWSKEMRAVWVGSAFYDEAREWALKLPAESFARGDSKEWVKTAGSKWPPIILRNTVKLQDGAVVEGFNSFLVETAGKVVAVTALNRLDVQRSVFGKMQPAPIYVKDLNAKLAAWTMTSDTASSSRLTVASVEPRNYPDEAGSKIRGAVATLKPSSSAPPVYVLKLRASPVRLHSRAYVVGCAPAIKSCKQAAFAVEIYGRIPLSATGNGYFALEFQDNIDWHDFIGSPVVDEDGLVAGVIAEDSPSIDPAVVVPNRAVAEEIAFLLERPPK